MGRIRAAYSEGAQEHREVIECRNDEVVVLICLDVKFVAGSR
jgi:hypothetical protein